MNVKSLTDEGDIDKLWRLYDTCETSYRGLNPIVVVEAVYSSIVVPEVIAKFPNQSPWFDVSTSHSCAITEPSTCKVLSDWLAIFLHCDSWDRTLAAFVSSALHDILLDENERWSQAFIIIEGRNFNKINKVIVVRNCVFTQFTSLNSLKGFKNNVIYIIFPQNEDAHIWWKCFSNI